MKRAPLRVWARDYLQALRSLPELLSRLAFKRRNLDDELAEASLRGSLRKTFSGWELLLFGIGIVIGTGIYSQNGTAAFRLAGPSTFFAYILGSITALTLAIIYGEFVKEYPVSGGGFTYTMLTFGELPAWLTVSNLILSYVVGMASIAKNVSVNISRLTNYSQTFVIELGAPGGWQVDYFAFAAAVLATALLCLGGREYSFLISGSTILKLAAILTIVIASLTKADAANLGACGPPASAANNCPSVDACGFVQSYTLDPPNCPALYPGTAENVFQAMALLAYAYMGFDALTNAAEEARDPGDLPPAMVGTVVTAFVCYLLLALSFSLMASFGGAVECICPDNSQGACNLSRIFQPGDQGYSCIQGVAMQWCQYFVAVVGLLAVAAGLLVGLFSLARLVMVAARDWLLPPFLARIYPRTQTPVAAQCTVGAVVAVIALVVPVDNLYILVNFGTLFAMWMVCNAHLYRRYYPDIKLRYTKYGQVEAAKSEYKYMRWVPGTRLPRHVQEVMVWGHLLLITGISIGLTVYWRVTSGNAGTAGFLGGWALATLSFQLLCPLEYQPEISWAVPWWAMPWLPSAAILLVVFSIGSLEAGQMWRVGAWFGASLLFYLLFSLPMSYLKRNMLDHVNAEQMNVLELTYQDGKWVYPAHSMTAAASGSLAAPASAGSTLTISPSSYSSTHFKAAAALHSNGHPLGPYLSGRHSGSVRVIGGLQRGSAPSSTASGAGTPLARAAPGSGGLSVPPSPCDSAYHAHMLRHSSGAQPVVTGGAGAAAPGAGWTRPPAGPSYRAASGALPQIPSGSLPSGTTLPPIPAPAARARSGELSPRAHLGAARPGAAPMQPHG